MTELFKKAVEAAGKLPANLQDEIARTMLAMTEWSDAEEDVYVLSAGEKAGLAKSLEQAARGEFATDEEMDAIWAKYE